MGHFDTVQPQPHIIADDSAAGHYRHVFQERLPAVAEPRRFDGNATDGPSHFVHYQSGQCLPFHILGYYHQGPSACLGDHLKDWNDVVVGAYFLIGDQEQRLVQRDLHAVGIGYEMRRYVAAVDANALYDVQFVFQRLGLFDRDNSFPPHLVHRVCQKFRDSLFVG